MCGDVLTLMLLYNPFYLSGCIKLALDKRHICKVKVCEILIESWQGVHAEVVSCRCNLKHVKLNKDLSQLKPTKLIIHLKIKIKNNEKGMSKGKYSSNLLGIVASHCTLG